MTFYLFTHLVYIGNEQKMLRKFRHSIFWPSGFREEFSKSTNQKKELPMVAVFFNW
jgi:hypothetical protein